MIKIIATSDWHLGNLFHGNDRLPEHKHFLNWLLEQVKTHEPDALLVAGDVFDNGNPSAASQSAYYEFLADATQACPQMQVIITAGNHDSASRLEAPRPMLTRHKVEIRGTVHREWRQATENENGYWQVYYDDLLIPVSNSQGEQVVVLAVPYLRSDMVQNPNYSQGVNNFLRDLTQRARELYPGQTLVMMAHMYAKGADIAKSDYSEKIVIGGQEEVNMEGWTDHPDYMTCGHIHKRQHIWNTDWARYTGSVLPMSFAEKDYTHGVDLVTFEADRHPKVEQLVYEPQHKLVVLPDDDSELSPAKLKTLIKKALPDRLHEKPDEDSCYVVLKVKMDKANNDDIRELEDLMNTKNAVLCKIQKIMPQTDVSTIVGSRQLKSLDDILNRDPMETLKEAYLIEHGIDMSEEQTALLTDLLNGIKNETNV